MIKKIVVSIILILALCGVPFTLFAQGVKCTISGKVIDHSDFIFSRDISSAATSRFGYWTFNNGFGVIDSCGVTIYDHTMRKVVQNDNSDTTRLHNGKAILQRTFMEINRLK